MGSVSSSDSHTTTPNAVTLVGKTHNKLVQNDRTRCDARHEAGGESLGNFKDDKGPAKSKLYDVAGNPHIDPSGGIGASCLEQSKRIDPRRAASWTSEADDDISLFKRHRTWVPTRSAPIHERSERRLSAFSPSACSWCCSPWSPISSHPRRPCGSGGVERRSTVIAPRGRRPCFLTRLKSTIRLAVF